MRKNRVRVMCLGLAAIIMLLSLPAASAAAQEPIRVVLNGAELSFDVPPQVINDRTMVPMRRIFEALDAAVVWEEETQTVTATKDDSVVKMQIDNHAMSVNAQEITLDVPPQLVGERTLVPVRAVAEGLRAEVDWLEKAQTVIITTAFVSHESNETPSYEVNNRIPEYSAVTGKDVYESFEPDRFNNSWQYVYKYDASDVIAYIDCLQRNGFTKRYSGKTRPGADMNYYSDGVDGLFLVFNDSDALVYIILFQGGIAEEPITLTAEESYKENLRVPNYGWLMETEPIRFDAGYTAAGSEIAIYLYPYTDMEPLWYSKVLQESGWELAGQVPVITDGPFTKVTYIKDGELMGVVIDSYLNMVTVSFEITNEAFSKQ